MELLNLYGYEYPTSSHVVSYRGEDGFIDVFGLEVWSPQRPKWALSEEKSFKKPLPTLEELPNQCGESAVTQMQVACLSVDCVHLRKWNVSPNLK